MQDHLDDIIGDRQEVDSILKSLDEFTDGIGMNQHENGQDKQHKTEHWLVNALDRQSDANSSTLVDDANKKENEVIELIDDEEKNIDATISEEKEDELSTSANNNLKN